MLAELAAYWPLYAAELLLPLLAVFLFWKPRERTRSRAWKIAGMLVLVGMFAHRLMLLFPSFNVVPLYAGLTPAGSLWEYPVSTGLVNGAPAFATSTAYVPTFGEWGVAFLAIGFVLLVATSVVGHYVLGSRRTAGISHDRGDN